MTYNFSSGPAMIPSEVMKEANQEFLDYSGSGMSVMELNHRSILFNEIIDEAKADLKDLLEIPNNYKVLFLLIPFSLLREKQFSLPVIPACLFGF